MHRRQYEARDETAGILAAWSAGGGCGGLRRVSSPRSGGRGFRGFADRRFAGRAAGTHFPQYLRPFYRAPWRGDLRRPVGGRKFAGAQLQGIRKRLVEEMRKIKAPVVRYPGGCFADSYDWRDGVGPADKRPRRTNFWDDAETKTPRPKITNMNPTASAPTNSCVFAA